MTGLTFDDPLRAACPTTCPQLPDETRIGLRHRFEQANGLRFHKVEDGPTALVPELTDGLDAWVPGLHLARIPEASHWVQHEQPASVNQLLLEHLSE